LAVLSGTGASDLAKNLEHWLAGSSAGPAAGASGPGGPGAGAGGADRSIEVAPLGEDRWSVRAPDYSALADALAAVERPGERVRVEIGPVRF
jgi:hypothetical protein